MSKFVLNQNAAKMLKTHLCVSLFCTLLIAGCASHRQNDITQYFEQARADNNGDVIYAPEAAAYFDKCCETYIEAVKILEENGFDVFITKKNENPEFFEKHKKALDFRDADEISVYAKKKNNFPRLWPYKYEIRLYIQNNKINRSSPLIRYAPPL